MVILDRKEVHSGSSKKPPEKTSWKIRMKGMTVIAAVVVWAMQEISRAIMSEA